MKVLSFCPSGDRGGSRSMVVCAFESQIILISVRGISSLTPTCCLLESVTSSDSWGALQSLEFQIGWAPISSQLYFLDMGTMLWVETCLGYKTKTIMTLRLIPKNIWSKKLCSQGNNVWLEEMKKYICFLSSFPFSNQIQLPSNLRDA